MTNGKASQHPILAKLIAEVEQEEAQERQEQELKVVESDAVVPDEFKEAAPDVWSDKEAWRKRKAEQQAEEDDALNALRIREVYEKLTGNKVNPKRTGGKNEILVFCPSSDHHNTNTEAACINIQKNTWVCYGQCDNGGGVVDMVAAANGLVYGKQSKGKDFAKAKQITLEQFCGWEFVKDGKGYVGKSPERLAQEAKEFSEEYGVPLEEPAEEPAEEPVKKKSAQEVAEELGFNLAAVDDDLPEIGPTSFSRKEFGADSDKDEPHAEPTPTSDQSSHIADQAEAKPASGDAVGVHEEPRVESPALDPDIDTADLLPEISGVFENIPKGTALYEYMRVVEEMSIPKEFSLFRGLQLLSLSAGPYVRGRVGRPFKTTLSVLFVGATGAGKSQSRKPMNQVLDHIVYNWLPNPPSGRPYGTHTGVKRLIEPGSGEYLLQELSQEVEAGVPYKIQDVMADLEVDELSRFMGKGAMVGSSLVGIFQEMDNDPGLNAEIRAGSRSGGTIIATNPNLVFSAGVQPKALPQLIGRGNIGNGLLARFEIVTGNKLIASDPFDDKMKDTDHCQELYTDIAAYYLGKVDPEGKGVRKLVYLDVHQSARDLMRQYYHTIEQWKHDDDIKSRFDLKLFKFATLFAVNRKADLVMREDIECAMWVMEYLNRSTTITGERTVVTQGGEIEDAITSAVSYYTARKGYATQGDINMKARVKKNGWDPADVWRRLDMLVERGEIVVAPSESRRGPKAARYVHPETARHKKYPTVTNITKNKKDSK
ncbi:DNA helicase [Gordonia phage Woes]|uniref:DNA helicase n=1 Tax=Gordonia phage Woes TaxID=1838084 RepID=A0A160DDB8_9CAUD|nr:helicase [Gordonia phage Woes]ANA85776.1 DNA helicase [Gordonia phage Woes]